MSSKIPTSDDYESSAVDYRGCDEEGSNSIFNFLSRNFFVLAAISYLFGLVQATAYAIRDQSFNHFLTWKLTQYYVNYFDLGFVKRGLVGTIFYPIFNAIGENDIAARIVILVIDISLFAVLIVLINNALNRMLPQGGRLANIIRAVLIFAPVGLMQISYDRGRFDLINILLVGFGLRLLLNRRFISAGAVMAIGVLVHEAIFVFGFPVLMAVSIAVSGSNASWRNQALDIASFASLPVIAAAAVAIFGSSTVELESVLPTSVAEGAIVWSRGLFEPSLGLSVGQYIVLAFYIVMPYFLLKKIYELNNLSLDLLFFSCLSPLALFALGHDYARWTQLIFISVAAAISFHAARGNLVESKRWSKASILGLLLYSLPFGPIGVTQPLPYMDLILRRVFGA